MFSKYHRSLDLMIAAALHMRDGDQVKAAKALRAAVDNEGFDDAVDELNEGQVDAIEGDGDEGDGEDEFEAFASAADEEVDDTDVTIEDEGISDGGLRAEDGADLPAITARLVRASRNSRSLKQR